MLTALDDRQLDDTFAALANSTRRAILARLAHGEASVSELAAPFEMTLPAVSKHIKVLEHAGLVERSHRAQSRPCSLAPGRLAMVSTWAEQYRWIWEERFDRFETYMSTVSHTPTDPSTSDTATDTATATDRTQS